MKLILSPELLAEMTKLAGVPEVGEEYCLEVEVDEEDRPIKVLSSSGPTQLLGSTEYLPRSFLVTVSSIRQKY